MNRVVLSLSYSIGKKLDVGAIERKIREIGNSYIGAVFIMGRTIKGIDSFLGTDKIVVYTPVFTMFDSKAQAYIDRNNRMVKYGTECYAIIDIDDKGLYPLSVAHAFVEEHPGYLCQVFVHADGVLKEISLEGARDLFKWQVEMSRYK